MQKENEVSAKNILRNMSKLPWSEGIKYVNKNGVHCQSINASMNVTDILTVNGMTDELYPYSGKADLAATITAVNNTYGKGLDPEMYSELEYWLLRVLNAGIFFTSNDLEISDNAMEALKKARI